MALKEFIRTKVGSDEPVVSIRDNRFYFNVIFLKIASALDKHYVTYLIDESTHEIFFDFSKDRVSDNCYSFDSKRKRASAGEIIKRFNWVNNIHASRNNEEKKFVAFQRKNLWGIRIRPSFEYKVSYENKGEINSSISGIYKYLDNEDKIIYIGKGNIRNRLNDIGRDKWEIKTIEYSEIENDDEQYRWENYWIEKYKESHSNSLPVFNRISGVKK
jgi:hypothetical protein